MDCRLTSSLIAGMFLFVASAYSPARAQQQNELTSIARGQLSGMLHDAYTEVKKHYYDPKIEGIDLDARYQQFSAKLQNAKDLGQGMQMVEAFLHGLKDSHTFFIPPDRATKMDYGFRLALVGNDCFVTQVRPDSDAASKLHIGDQVVSEAGFRADREGFHDLQYYLMDLAPHPILELILRSPAGELRTVTVKANIRQKKQTLDFTQDTDYYDEVRREQNEDHATRERMVESDNIAIWNMPQFGADIDGVEKLFAEARKHSSLILDLRGNSGGSVETLELMLGKLFDHDVKICSRVGRKDMKPLIAKHFGQTFRGKLIVLVDGGSASASELLARVVQLEHRGTVLGDRTAGAVMEARRYQESQGADVKLFYGFSVTEANLIMADGQSLEKTGVVPDELLLPTGADLAAHRDPVLSRAAALAGVRLDPEVAGKLFPFEWLSL